MLSHNSKGKQSEETLSQALHMIAEQISSVDQSNRRLQIYIEKGSSQYYEKLLLEQQQAFKLYEIAKAKHKNAVIKDKEKRETRRKMEEELAQYMSKLFETTEHKTKQNDKRELEQLRHKKYEMLKQQNKTQKVLFSDLKMKVEYLEGKLRTVTRRIQEQDQEILRLNFMLQGMENEKNSKFCGQQQQISENQQERRKRIWLQEGETVSTVEDRCQMMQRNWSVDMHPEEQLRSINQFTIN